MTSIREDGLLGIILVSKYNQCVPSAQERKKTRDSWTMYIVQPRRVKKAHNRTENRAQQV